MINMKNHSLAVMISLLLTVCCVAASEIGGIPFEEPVYPTQKNVELLGELAWFFGGPGEYTKERTRENWKDLQSRLSTAGLPRLATKADLKITKESIENLSDVPVLIVLGHQHPVNTALNVGAIRTHWLVAKGKIENHSGFGERLILTWEIPHDPLGWGSQMPKFLEEAKSEQGGADQPTTAPELKSEGKDKPQPESKVAPR